MIIHMFCVPRELVSMVTSSGISVRERFKVINIYLKRILFVLTAEWGCIFSRSILKVLIKSVAIVILV